MTSTTVAPTAELESQLCSIERLGFSVWLACEGLASLLGTHEAAAVGEIGEQIEALAKKARENLSSGNDPDRHHDDGNGDDEEAEGDAS